MKPAGLTFAIPFYSGRELLERAIQSVVAQTNSDWRLIVCDDHSSEMGIAGLCRSFADARITYCRNERNLGMAGNWNRCLDLAATSLVTLLHADDELLPEYCARMLAAAVEFPRAVAFYCRARVIDRKGRRILSVPECAKAILQVGRRLPDLLQGERSVAALLRGNFIMCPTLCYRKDLLEDRRFDSSWSFVQDLEFTTRLLMQGELLVGLPEKLYAYRRHIGSATSRYTENLLRFREEFQVYDELERRLRQRSWFRAGRVARRKRIIKLYLAYCAGRDILSLRMLRAREKLRLLKRAAGGLSRC